MGEMIGTAEIAQRYNLERRYVTDRLTKAQGFPEPTVDLSQKLRRWDARIQVDAAAIQRQDLAGPHRRAQADQEGERHLLALGLDVASPVVELPADPDRKDLATRSTCRESGMTKPRIFWCRGLQTWQCSVDHRWFEPWTDWHVKNCRQFGPVGAGATPGMAYIRWARAQNLPRSRPVRPVPTTWPTRLLISIHGKWRRFLNR